MWADITAWFQSPGGARVLQTAIVPALAILVAGVLAALIGRAAVGAAIRRADREQASTAVAGLVEAARAAAEADGTRGDRRRAARLRTEADVRVRLLPLPGAARAADWAAARTDRLVGAPDAPAQVAQLRDALIAWVGAPRRAKRLFPVDDRPAVQGPSVAPAAAAEQDEVPAWRRTRSAELLQQQHDSRAEPPREDTAPVRLQRSHRADAAPIAEVEQLEQVEAHQASRFSRPAPAPAMAVQAPTARPAPSRPASSRPAPAQPASAQTASAQTAPADHAEPSKPEWLDDYDDEAHVTQTMNLKTPPPVAVSAIRDRSSTGDIVPRP